MKKIKRRRPIFSAEMFNDRHAVMTYKEIGEKLGIDERQVRYIERRALRKLRDVLGGNERAWEYFV